MEYLNYWEHADLPDGRKFRQLELLKNQATNLSVKAAGLNLKAMAIKISRKIATAKLLMQNM